MNTEKHQEILKVLQGQKGVTEVKELFENPNRYGDTVSSFLAKHSVKSQSEYKKTEVKIDWCFSVFMACC